MPRQKKRGFSTRSLHTPTIPYLHPMTHTMPPYLTSTYAMESLQPPENPEFSFKYPRIATPNGVLLEHTLASLEEGEAAVVTTDGMRAISLTLASVLKLCSEGLIVCTTPLYSDTYNHLTKDVANCGKKIYFLQANELPINTFLNLLRAAPLPEILYIESPANPTLSCYDIEILAHIAHRKNIPVIVDNTFASPYNQRPLTLGADLVIQSLTKYCSGNGTTLGGAVIGSRKLIAPIRQRGQREGGHLSPFSAWLIQQGLQTFKIRMETHNKNAMMLAKFLQHKRNEEKIEAVHYPGLPSHPQHHIARAQMKTPYGKSGFGGMVSFELRKPEWVDPFAEHLAKKSFIELAVSLGSTSSTFSIPTRQIHASLPPNEREALGIRDTLVRFSVGIEDFADIKQAFIAAFRSLT
ncbi:MAG: aminotransferase class I/II-fold pyridoxal phosphate-dependent enzyme [bacterium]|nr:aminotransferase class I/II-fold pyridoxal phosphate-dependent enzyme [bacterium]